ncbi:MAG: hypothetical protein IT317_12020 [Anaerolineales bacterium]|nr:hypothetical protein [Anaerolineales bacterium]
MTAAPQIASPRPRPSLSLEAALYLLIFFVALALRLYHLGAHPLNDAEARQALSALNLLRGADVTPGAHSPAYLFLSYLLFLLFGASDAAARFGPALAGAALALTPALYRDRLGRPTALALSGLLAVSATLLAASRSADGLIFAVLALAFTLGALREWGAKGSWLGGGARAWLFLTAIGLGLGIASGGRLLLGLLALALVGVIWRWTGPDQGAAIKALLGPVLRERRLFALTAALSALVIATIALVSLRGLGVLLDSWLAALAGFVPAAAGSRSPVEVLLFLVVYEPLLLIFGLIGAVRAFRTGDGLGQALAWFALVALTLIVLYSARQVADLAWVVLPLAGLAARALAHYLRDLTNRAEWPLAAAQAGLTTALLGFAQLNLAGLAQSARNTGAFTTIGVPVLGQTYQVSALAQLGIAGLAVTLTFVIAYLLALGWSAAAARLGLAAAGAVFLLGATLSAGWGLTQRGPGSPAELWWAVPASPDVGRLMTTLTDVSNYTVGNPHDIELTVQAEDDGLLAWALRNFTHASFVDRLDPVIDSPVVIAPLDTTSNPTLGSAYVGQAFTLRSTWTPDLSRPEWVVWLVFRVAPTQVNEPAVLWVRQDVQQLQTPGTGN